MAPRLNPIRRRLIVMLREAGYKIKEIEEKTGITRKTIRLWLRRNEETGGDLTAHHRQNYKRITTTSQDLEIVALHVNNPVLSPKLTASRFSISTDTVRRRLRESGLRHKKAKSKNAAGGPEAKWTLSGKDKKSHICTYNGCGVAFSRPYRLRNHIQGVHQQKKSFICPIQGCGKGYNANQHLVRHVKNSHFNESGVESHQCPVQYCTKKYSNKQNLQKHLKSAHTNTFHCEVCHLEFKQENFYLSHMYTHTGIKSFRCDECEVAFASHIQKRRHMNRHKTFRCDDCSLTFHNWPKYNEHRKTAHRPIMEDPMRKESNTNNMAMYFQQIPGPSAPAAAPPKEYYPSMASQNLIPTHTLIPTQNIKYK